VVLIIFLPPAIFAGGYYQNYFPVSSDARARQITREYKNTPLGWTPNRRLSLPIGENILTE
jgi:hypothetical protein